MGPLQAITSIATTARCAFWTFRRSILLPKPRLDIPMSGPFPSATTDGPGDLCVSFGIIPRTAQSGSRNGSWRRVSRSLCFDSARAERGAVPPREVVGAGNHPEEPEGYACGGDHAEIVRILRQCGSPRCLDHGGCGWTGRNKEQEARARCKKAKTSGGSEDEGGPVLRDQEQGQGGWPIIVWV